MPAINFTRTYQIQTPNGVEEKDSYNLRLLVQGKPGVTGERVLCVFTYPMEQDMSGVFGADSSQGEVVSNILRYVMLEQNNFKDLNSSSVPKGDIPFLSEYGCIAYKDFEVDNFVALEKDLPNEIHKLWTERIVDYIKEYKPTRIWFLGDLPFKAFRYHACNVTAGAYIENPFEFMGRIYNYEVEGLSIPYSFTIPAHLTGTSNPKWVDSMPYLIHNQKFHFEELLHGKNRYTVTDSSTWETHTISTIEEFDDFYSKLLVNKVTCVDLETANLTRKANTLLTIHFSLDGKSAYNLPLFHRESPFIAEEQEYIKKKLAEYFQDGESEYLIFHNAKFDTSVLMGQLNLKFFNHKVFDTIGGTFCFHPDTLVETEQGPLPISKLCSREFKDTLVKSFNHITGQVELKPILSSVTLRNLKPMVEIAYEGGRVSVTEDHEIWSNTRNCYIEASKIEEGEEILVSCSTNAGRVTKVQPTTDSEYVCDVTIRDNHNLFVGHPDSDKFILVHNCLSENNKFLTEALNVPMYGLKTLAYQYGCSAYEEGNLTKESRRNMASQKLVDIMEYASKDVIIPYQIHQFQIQEAERRGYKNWKTFVVEQLGAMILVFARMEVMGILVDKKYLMFQMSKEGQVGKLLAETTEAFKTSEHCQTVNKYLLVQQAISEDLKLQVSKTKLLGRKIKSILTKLDKPLSAKKVKEQAGLGLFPDDQAKEQVKANLKVLQALLIEGKDTFNKSLVDILEELKEFVDKRVERLGEFPELVEKLRLAGSISRIEEAVNKCRNPLVEEEFLENIDGLVSSLKLRLDRKYYRENIGNEWLFDIAKRSTQQLLFFTVLKLQPLEQRKDGGGKTNVAFQETHKETCKEVAWYDNYTKYKKLMSTYIEGIYERLTQEKEQREYQEKLKEVLGTEDEALLRKPEPSDSLVDGRLRADYGYAFVVTGRCLRGDMKVLTDKGELEIEKIVKEKIQCNVLTHTGTWKPVIDWFENGEKDLFEVETELGNKIVLTANHPLLTRNGWVRLEDLREGDDIIGYFVDAEDHKLRPCHGVESNGKAKGKIDLKIKES